MARNFAVVVGINNYKKMSPLKYAKSDAEKMRNFFMQDLQVSPENLYFFSDDSPCDFWGRETQPTYSNLETFFTESFETPFLKAGDTLWFYFSGHGMRYEGRDCLLPIDFSLSIASQMKIPLSRITDRLRQSGADNIVMLIDACRSDGQKNADMGIGQEKQQGVITFFSCSPSQVSYEIDEIGQGAFTNVLLEALRIQGEGNCATVERFSNHLKIRVPELTRKYKDYSQIPYAMIEPETKLHYILLPNFARDSDVALLREDAFEAESEGDFTLAFQLWMRVNVAARGTDLKAINAFQRLANKQMTSPPQIQQKPNGNVGSKRNVENKFVEVPQIINFKRVKNKLFDSKHMYSKQIKVVVAIELNASKAGYAYAFNDDKRIIGRTEWEKQPFARIFTIPDLLYTPDGKLDSWGYYALSRLAELRQSKSAKGYSFFRSFMFLVQESRERDFEGKPLVIGSDGRKFAVIDLMADCLTQLKNLILSDLGHATSNLLHANEVLWCLTIPAIWNDTEKSFMREAAIKAGLINADEKDRERLLLVLEPEASILYCQTKTVSQLDMGKRCMVVDCGSSAVSITVYEISKHGGLEEVGETTGGAYGSTNVDAQFKNFLASKLTATALTHYDEADPIGYLELFSNWERKKCNFDPCKTEVTYFDIPNRLYRILLKDDPEVLEKLANTQNDDDEKIHISREMMIGIFTPVLDGLVNKIKEQFARLDRCDIMYLVGDFSTSPMLRQRIHEEFKDRIQIVMPALPSAAIVEGAVSFGLTPTIIRSRRTSLTYGIQVCQPFDDEHDRKFRSQRKYFEDKEDWYICNRFCTIVLAGEIVDVDTTIMATIPLLSLLQDKQTPSIKIFATESKNPRYVDEIGVIEVGNLAFEISSIGKISEQVVEISMKFGREIEFKLKNLQTDKTFSTTLNYQRQF